MMPRLVDSAVGLGAEAVWGSMREMVIDLARAKRVICEWSDAGFTARAP
jgi:hypothetical protein